MKINLLENINKLNSNKYLAGVALLMLNLGSKYLVIDISKSTEQLLKLTIIRRFTIFSIFFIATRNITVSFVLTGTFIIFSSSLFNDKSKFCILPKKLKETEIEPKEYQKALEIVEKYNLQKNNEIEIDKEKNIINENYNNMKKILNK
jgi:hypothetical protein|tara:strand:- start:1370 stop:1813 length:444 start_codon:yes stop_codon:yes gene_type:complete